MDDKKLIVFTGPSGVGKATVEQYFINDEDLNLHFSISATTRPKRIGEENGVHYHFLTREEFENRIAENEFVEWAEYAGNYYGTLKSEIENNIKNGKIVLLEIEVIGAKNIMNLYEDCTTIFLAPPSLEDLEKRLMKRNTDSENAIRSRLKIAKKELEAAKHFKYVVVNDDPQRAGEEIKQIIRKI